jgi:molybdopterin-guanine dinucleotide biosynthesis protein
LTHVDYIILHQLTVANIKSEESEELDPEGKDEYGTKETKSNEVIFETQL